MMTIDMRFPVNISKPSTRRQGHLDGESRPRRSSCSTSRAPHRPGTRPSGALGARRGWRAQVADPAAAPRAGHRVRHPPDRRRDAAHGTVPLARRLRTVDRMDEPVLQRVQVPYRKAVRTDRPQCCRPPERSDGRSGPALRPSGLPADLRRAVAPVRAGWHVASSDGPRKPPGVKPSSRFLPRLGHPAPDDVATLDAVVRA
jgi:hypothetical protein